RMVVLQVLPSLVTGGVERGTVEMARAVAEAGGTALVASAGGRLVGAIRHAGGRHVTLPLDTKDPLNVLWNARRLTELIRAEGGGRAFPPDLSRRLQRGLPAQAPLQFGDGQGRARHRHQPPYRGADRG